MPHLSRTSRPPVLAVVGEGGALQGPRQAIFGQVAQLGSTALGHHPRHPGGLQEVHLEIWLWIRGGGAPAGLHHGAVGNAPA